jgi:hypothetical protein
MARFADTQFMPPIFNRFAFADAFTRESYINISLCLSLSLSLSLFHAHYCGPRDCPRLPLCRRPRIHRLCPLFARSSRDHENFRGRGTIHRGRRFNCFNSGRKTGAEDTYRYLICGIVVVIMSNLSLATGKFPRADTVRTSPPTSFFLVARKPRDTSGWNMRTRGRA